jgi:F-type H+-transporting ATPase subunit c
MGLAVLGGGLGQGRIAAAFMEGVSRNPSAANVTRTPLILSLVFVETLVLFTVLIALMLVGKMV